MIFAKRGSISRVVSKAGTAGMGHIGKLRECRCGKVLYWVQEIVVLMAGT